MGKKKKKERWRWIPGYEGCYKVSTLGRVRRLARYITDKNNKSRYQRSRLYSSSPKDKSYRNIKLTNNGKSNYYSIHQLVMRAFVGPCPEGLMCCHNDGNPANNRLSNLRYDTNSSNQMDRHRHGNAATGTANHNSLLTNKQVARIRKLYSTGNYTYKRLGKKFGVDLTTVGDVVRRRTYKNVGSNGEELDHTSYQQYNGDAHVGKKYTAFGKTLTLKQWSKKTGLGRERLRTRFNKGWSAERALTEPVQSTGRTYTAFGKTLTISEWAEEQGICESTLRGRLSKGWSLKKVLTKLTC